MLVVATLGAPKRRRLRDRRPRPVPPEPPPAEVTTTRATVIDAEALPPDQAERWLAEAGVPHAERAFASVEAAVRSHRIASADPSVHEPALAQALVVRAGYGAGEEVADGRWTAAREIPLPAEPRRRRTLGLGPHERVAAMLAGRVRPLVCEEIALRARDDLDRGHLRVAAVQLRAALTAAVGELPAMAGSSTDMADRIGELRERETAVAALASAALADDLPSDAAAVLDTALQRLEAALRARTHGQLST